MEIHQLEYIVAVETYRSFTKAAESKNVSQPSLSQQIKKLEDELGVNLFIRTTRSVQLTPAGAEFVSHAKRILSEIYKARQNILEFSSYERGHLTVGIMPAISYYNLTPMLTAFKRDFPGVKLNLLESECDGLYQLLRSAKIDAAIFSLAKNDPQLKYYELQKDQLVLVANKNHPFASKLSIGLKELENEKLITPPVDSGNYKDFFQACLAMGFEPKVLMHCSQIATITDLVRGELGLAILASCVAESIHDPNIAIIPITPTINRKIYLAVRKDDGLMPILKVFVRFARQWVFASADNSKNNKK